MRDTPRREALKKMRRSLRSLGLSALLCPQIDLAMLREETAMLFSVLILWQRTCKGDPFHACALVANMQPRLVFFAGTQSNPSTLFLLQVVGRLDLVRVCSSDLIGLISLQRLMNSIRWTCLRLHASASAGL